MASYLWRKYADYVYSKWERTILWDMVEPYRRPKSFTPLVSIYIAAFYSGVIASAITEQLYKEKYWEDHPGEAVPIMKPKFYYGPWRIMRGDVPSHTRNMTRYGTIPTEPVPTSNHSYICHARERIQFGLGTHRPWMEMIQLQDLSFPTSFLELINRIKDNAEFFRMNYIIIILSILFLSLLWHPVSLVVFLSTFVVWLFLYFLRDEPWVVWGSTMDDRLVMVVLMLITMTSLFVTHATENIIISMFIGTMVVVVHGALRETEDLLFVDEDGVESASDGNVFRMPLRNAASSSFSLP